MTFEEEQALAVGLEIHQQLSNPTKLFCACPTVKSEELIYSFERRLRPAQSEMGRVDPAAVFEYSKGKSNVYLWSPESSCLVDADEEPPHSMDRDALSSSLLVSRMLKSNVVDEVHVMRKIVIDGSNTGGFQRTAVVALGGVLRVDGTDVRVQSVTIEEDAARILGEDSSSRRFALDRLGVPLVEVALEPVSGTPELVGKVALSVGRVLRSTGRVARGLGTIRQDLNVSIAGGKVVEVKGVQKLNLVPKVVDYERRRQAGLVAVAEVLRKRGFAALKCRFQEVTELLRGSGTGVISRQIEEGGKAVCILAPGLNGVMGMEPYPGIRLGKEVAETARANGLGGIIHSDEFRNLGVSGDEELRLREHLGASAEDGLVLVAGPKNVVDRAVGPLIERVEGAPRGVPAETRAATDEGETRYMRPRPGAQRMYPETDIPDVSIGPEMLAKIDRQKPEHWEKKVDRLAAEYSLSRELALRLYDAGVADDFEALSKTLNLEPSVTATVLVDVPARMAREGVNEEALTLQVLTETLHAVDSGKVSKEAIPDILRELGNKGIPVSDAIRNLGLRAADETEVRATVDSVVMRERELVESKGEEAFSQLMGEAMKELRGRADGAFVGRLMRESLRKAISR
jgi:glutamyl-tRNA(Gln) amidotransferase subunit E